VTPKLDLNELRKMIDAVDQQILGLLHERVRLVKLVGEYKHQQGVRQVYDPDRERKVYERLSSLALELDPPLDDVTVRRVFERIVDECRRIEQHHID